ncbi:MAG: hypothetical protein H6793_02480 [Candidatus Nomurabacteria bacterium]|nr:MAG: hypothetical protein H6793_02480 [Candidatus Nomurabacteria bacterium]
MNLNTSTIRPRIEKLARFIKKNAVFLFVVSGLIIIAYLTFNIRLLANKEPSESAIAEKSSENKPINIDESAVKQIKQLQAVNLEIRALFEQYRDNPFQE